MPGCGVRGKGVRGEGVRGKGVRGKRVRESQRQGSERILPGATKPTEETDPLSKRLSNSTRARLAREGGRDLVEHTSMLISGACVFLEIPPSLRPAVPAGAAPNLSGRVLKSVVFVGSVAPFRDPLPRLPLVLRSSASSSSLDGLQPSAPELRTARLPHSVDSSPAKCRGRSRLNLHG
jgi:hypothetical protein